jgi:hypothetical protein
MDWQDELRKLDKQLSEGDISAQQYRRLRDELLAEASAPAQGRGARPGRPERPDPAPATPAPDADDTQIVEDATVTVDEDVVSAANARPAPDPDKTDTVSGDPDETVKVTVDERDTRVVEEPVTTRAVGQPIARAFRKPAPKRLPGPTPMAKPSSASPAGAPAKPSATPPAKPSARPSARPTAKPLAKPPVKPPVKPLRRMLAEPADELTDSSAVEEIAWPTTEEESDKKKKVPTFPPRPSDTPPPQAPPLPKPAPYTGHQVLGEEVFADAGPHSNARRAVTMLLSIVAVLAVVGGGVWYFVFRNDDPPAAQQANNPPGGTAQSEAPASTQPPSAKPGNVPPNLADVIGPLPGAADENSGTISAARAGQLKLVSREEVTAAEKAGVTEVIFRGSTKGRTGNGLLVFTTPDATAAADLTKAERTILRDAGFSNGKELRNGLPVLVRTSESSTVYRVVYSTGKYTVRFGVAQLDANPNELRQELEAIADTILAVLPSSG